MIKKMAWFLFVTSLQTPCFSGFNMGISLGVDGFRYTDTYSFNPEKVNFSELFSRQHHSTDARFNPYIFINYDRPFYDFYTGIEACVRFLPYRLGNETNKLTLSQQLFLTGRFGKQIYGIIFYLLAGGNYVSIQKSLDLDRSYSSLTLQKTTFSQSAIKPTVGLGMIAFFKQNWSFGLEYLYSFNRNMSSELNTRIFTFINPVGKNEVNLIQNTLLVKVIYSLD